MLPKAIKDVEGMVKKISVSVIKSSMMGDIILTSWMKAMRYARAKLGFVYKLRSLIIERLLI